jgi:hypothetical protein
MQICMVLEVAIDGLAGGVIKEDKSGAGDPRNGILRGALGLWDGSPEGAEALMSFFAHMSHLRIPKRRLRKGGKQT